MRASSAALLLALATALAERQAHAGDAKRYGLQLTLKTFEAGMRQARELGVGTIRFGLRWQLVQPRPHEFDWSGADRIVAEAQSSGIELLFVLRPISPWGTEQPSQSRGIYHSASMPKDMSQWTRFVEALAARYRGRGVHYEIDNEVAGPLFWSGSLEQYLELLQASYAAIKRADPGATVLASATGCAVVRDLGPQARARPEWERHQRWLEAILRTGAFDVVNVHDYYFPDDIVLNGFTFSGYLAHVSESARGLGVSKPIWITETGFPSRGMTLDGRAIAADPERQARWLRQAYQQAFAAGVERVFWLLPQDRAEPYFGAMGLIDGEGTPRPAWEALRSLSSAPSRRPR